MKMLRLFILFLFPSWIASDAQTYIIDTSEISFENKLRPSFHVVYDADAKTVKKAWDSYMKKNYKIRIKGIGLFADKDLIQADDVMMNSVSDKRMNLYARVTDIAGGSELKYFMSFGYDFFIGPQNYPSEFAGMKKVLNDFSVWFLTDYYKSEASRLTKRIKKIEKDIKSKEKAISKNNKKARKESEAVAAGLQAKNNALEREISELNTEISSIRNELERIKLKQGGITRN